MEENSGKYLFFYLKTGGGHLAPARAVAEKIKSEYGRRVEIILADGLAGSSNIIRKTIEAGYRNLINKAAPVFTILYAIHKIKVVSKSVIAVAGYFMKSGIEKQILDSNPDKIVIFHYLVIKPVYDVIRKYNLQTRVITVVTDPFTAPAGWFLRRDQNFIVFSEMLREKCVRMGIRNDYIRVFPFVLDQRFSGKISKSRAQLIRADQGFKPDSRIILIMGGGDGMPHGKKILEKIIKSNVDAEIAVVCGNNEDMYEHVNKICTKYKVDNVMVYRFIDFVYSLIAISDIVITKCGASTFMEILLLGKIPLINTYIWEQEKGNMEFVISSKMGIYEKRTKRIPDVVNNLLTDSGLYNSFVSNIRKASLKNGVNVVSDYILAFQN